jgi:taurine dioxygenase
MHIVASGASLGARVEGMDLSRALADDDFAAIERLLGEYGVLSFPAQALSSLQLKILAQRFGRLEVNVANSYQEAGLPEVMILSNIKKDGRPIGLSDAGQDWHTDMSYSALIAFANVLYGVQIPHRDGNPLGRTEFCNMRAAYDALSDEMKARLEGMTVTHDFNKFWENMRREKNSTRPALTEAQRRARPPVSHPIFLTHPISGKKVLYANPGYSMRINEMSQEESDHTLAFLFAHQTQDAFCYRHQWAQGDVLMWDNIGTIHNAVADYTPDEHRLIKRCQVAADRYFGDLS